MSSHEDISPAMGIECDNVVGATPGGAERDLSRLLQHHLLDRRISENEPGAVIGVYRDGVMIASAAAGLSSLEHRVPLSTSTPTDIASVSKQLTAATVLIAARDGLVDLDADIRGLVPEVAFDGVTLRRCLQHTSGLPDYLTIGDVIGIPPATVSTVDVFLELLVTLTEPDFPPGTEISYSNTGYVVAALALERQTGTAFPDLITATVLEPLDMLESTYKRDVGQVIPGMAFSYSPKDGGGFIRHEMGDDGTRSATLRCVDGDGDLFATIGDFANWHGFLLDGRVLGADILEQLLARSTFADGTVTSYGMGISHETIGGVAAYGHSGSMWGYTSYSLTDPASGVGVAVFSNRDDLGPMDLAWRALRLATDSRGLTGPWYSKQAERAIDVCLRPDGGIDLVVSGEPEPFAPTADGSWQSPLGFGSVRLVDETLEVTAEFDRLTRFRRIMPDIRPGVDPAGRYREPFRGGSLLIQNHGDETWTVGNGTLPSVTLRPFGTAGSTSIFEADFGSVHVDGDADDITLISGSMTVQLTHQRVVATDA